MFFFLKPRTAYEMRISDWSSDVCSSDLTIGQRNRKRLDDRVSSFVANAGAGSRSCPRGHRSGRLAQMLEHVGRSGTARRRRNADSTLRRQARQVGAETRRRTERSEEHTSELPALMRISSAVVCMQKKNLS